MVPTGDQMGVKSLCGRHEGLFISSPAGDSKKRQWVIISFLFETYGLVGSDQAGLGPRNTRSVAPSALTTTVLRWPAGRQKSIGSQLGSMLVCSIRRVLEPLKYRLRSS